MALAMTRPWKHPRTGIFWLRRRVPRDLLGVLGKREEKRTLDTRDPAEAKRRLSEALAEVEARWAALRSRTDEPQSSTPPSDPASTAPTALTERQAHEFAAWMHEDWLRRYRDNPRKQPFGRTDLFDRLWYELSLSDGDEPITSPLQWTGAQILDSMKVKKLEEWCLDEADTLLFVRDLEVDEASRLKLAKAL